LKTTKALLEKIISSLILIVAAFVGKIFVLVVTFVINNQ